MTKEQFEAAKNIIDGMNRLNAEATEVLNLRPYQNRGLFIHPDLIDQTDFDSLCDQYYTMLTERAKRHKERLDAI